MALTVAVDVPPGDRGVLESWTAVAVDAGGSGAAGPDRVAGGRWGGGEGHRGAGRGVQADGDRVEEALRGRGAGWAGRSAEAGPAGQGR